MERMVVMLEVSGRDHHNAQEFVSGIYIYIYLLKDCATQEHGGNVFSSDEASE